MREKDPKEKKRASGSYQKNIGFLSAAIEELEGLPLDADIYHYIAGSLTKITPTGTIILVNTFDPERNVVALHAFAGIGPHLPEIERILGRPLHGISFPVPDPAMIPLRTGECRELSGGVSALTFGGLPEAICRALEALPFFGRIYGAGISWKGILHGAVTFILPPGRELYNPRIVAIFVRMAAGYLQRRQGHEDLVRSENLYRTIFENTGTATIIVREDTTIELVNKGFENLSGYGKEDVEGKLSWTQFVVQEDLERMKRYHILRRQGSKFVPEIYEFRYTDRYGDVRNCINHIRMIPGTTKSIASILDVTELKKTEAALTESEASYIGLFNTFKDPVFIVGRDGKLRNANRGAIEMFGYPLEFFIGKTFDALSAPGFNDLAHIHEHITRASGGDVRMFEFRGRRSSGETFPLEVRLYTGMYFGQDVVIAIGADITERKKAEAALQESEKKYRELVENITDVVLMVNEHRVITYASPSFKNIFGWEPGQVTNLSMSEVFSTPALSVLRSGIYDTVQNSWTDTREQNQPVEVELTFFGHDKKVHVIEVRAMPVSENDTFRGVQVIIRDVTQRRQAEDALRASEERYRSLVENVTIGVFRATADALGTFTWANPALVKILGYDSLDHLKKTSVVDLYVNPADRAAFLERLNDEGCIRNQELNLHRKDGSKIWIRETAYVTKNERGETEYLAGIIEDITEQRLAEEAVRESEQRFRAMFVNMHAGVAVYQVTGDGEDFIFKDFNPAAERISRISRDQVIGQRLLSVFPNMDEFGLFAALQRVYRTGRPEHLPAAQYMDPYREGWRDNYLYRLPSGDVVAIYEDVTEQKIAEEALRQSEKRYRELTELLPQTVYEVDTSGRITFANRFAFTAFGYTREDFEAGLHVSQMIHPDDRDRALRDMERVIHGENVVGDGYRALRKDGTTFPVIIYGDRIIRGNVVVGMRGVVADISEHTTT